MHDAATVALDDTRDQIQVLSQDAMGTIFVLTGETRVSRNVRVQDCGKLAGQAVGVHDGGYPFESRIRMPIPITVV